MQGSDSGAPASEALIAPVASPGAARIVSGRVGEADVEAFFRSHRARLGQFLAQVVSDRSLAEDLLQETFLVATRKHAVLASIENPEAWLFGIARNQALHALRTRGRAWRALQRLARERRRVEPDPADAVAVRDYLARHLKPEERVLLVLRYLHGYGSRELAEISGRSPEAIRKELSRLKQRLVQALDDSPPRPRGIGGVHDEG